MRPRGGGRELADNMRRFDGQAALVTGSGRGIGRAIALRLAQEGCDVAVNFFRNRVTAEETARLVSDCGARSLVVKANIGDPERLDGMFQQVEAEFGGLDILINNAASGFIRPSLEQDARGWDWTMNINARAALLASQRAARLMEKRGGGSIVSISSLGSQRVLPEYVVIGCSKAALESLTRYLAVELAPLNIRVNAVSGGIVETGALEYFPRRAQMISAGLERTPAGRLVEPDDIAATVAFLCSRDAWMIRGQTIVVDGGYSVVA
jgi:enoyl-[acyl-carrier protein] reductase III